MDPEITANDNASNVEDTASEQAAQETPEEMVPLSKLKEIEETNRQLFERAKKAEGFVKVDGKWVKAPKLEEAVATESKLKATAGELEAAQLDFFDLKGYSEPEEVEVFQSIMKRTGMSHRDVIKDEYALSKIQSLRKSKEVKAATPTATKRSGQATVDDVGHWLAKLDAGTAKLSDIPYATRAAVYEERVRRASENNAPWRR